MKLVNIPGQCTRGEKRLSMNMYYAYQIHDRLNHYSLLSRGETVEQNRLDYIRQNQSGIKNEYLSGIYDAIMRGDRDGNDLGTRIVLTASFTGGPRYTYSHYLDALAIYRAHVVDRVFEQKIRDYVKYVRTAKPFGDITAVEECGVHEGRNQMQSPFPKSIFQCHLHRQRWLRPLPSKRNWNSDRKAKCSPGQQYLFKYISKGTDRVVANITTPIGGTATTNITPNIHIDEIKNFVEARYIGPHEACWRILEFPIHYRDPAVQILAVHSENMQQIRFRSRERLQSIVDNPTKKKTTLTEWLDYNAHNTDGRHLTYLEFPSEYAWHATDKYWQRRRNLKKPSIDLCQSDQEWVYALEEASIHATAAELRKLFVQILIFCDVSDPISLCETFWKHMSDDIPRRLSRTLQIPDIQKNETKMKAAVLFDIEAILNSYSKSLKDFGLPMPPKRLLDIL
ncbi:DNA helicase [Tanacetum coccineum]